VGFKLATLRMEGAELATVPPYPRVFKYTATQRCNSSESNF